jgi:SAM-dependent methyltransferase
MFLADKPHIRYVGVDRENAALEYGREMFPDAHFYHLDCETEDFSDQLTSIEDELGIDGFDYINISMLLLHLHRPSELLDTLSNHLAEDGQIIVLDIDDGFNIAYPDPKGYFKKAVDICFQLEYSGYRHCGRTVYKMFSDVDLRDVRLHRIGLSTVEMNRREKDEFYEIYFSFILDDLRKMHEEFPNNKFVETDLKWLEENYKDMKLEFKKKDFFFTLGFVLFTAKP